MDKRGKKSLISIFVTISVIILLIMTGPVKAVTVGVADISSTTPEEGSDVTFTVYVDIQTFERIPVQNLTLSIISGGASSNYSCTFGIGGNAITACTGITITKNNAVGYGNSTMWGYGYGYNFVNPNLWNYTNQTFESGYGYGYTDYESIIYPYGELSYNVTWTTPSVTANTSYSIDFQAMVSDGTTRRVYSMPNPSTITVKNSAATATNDTTTSSSSSSNGLVPIIPSVSNIPAASELGAPAGYTDVRKYGDPVSMNQVTSTSAIDDALKLAAGDAKATLEQLKSNIATGLSKAQSVSVSLQVYEVKNPINGLKVYKSMVTVSFTAQEEGKEIKLIEVIPKSVANDVSVLVFPGKQPVILQADPIVQWTFTDVKKGDKLSANYVVPGKLGSVNSTSIAALTKEAPKTETTTPPATQEDKQPETVKTEDIIPPVVKKSYTWVWFILGAVVIVGAIVTYILLGKREENNGK